MFTPTLAFIGGHEVILVVLLVLLLFGAKKLPGLARGIGRSLGEFKKGKDESDAIEAEIDKKDSED